MSGITSRIPRNLGGSDTLFDDAPLVGTVEFTDGIVAFGPGVATLFIVNRIVPPEHGWIALGASSMVVLAGLLLLLLKPDYLTLSDWVRNYREFRKRPSEIQKQIRTDGGQGRDVPVSSQEDTRRHVKVEKIYPAESAIERDDGAMVGMVKIGGVNLDTATAVEWQDAGNQLSNFFNTQLEYDVQLYLPMRQFDPSDQVQMYLDRVDDPDCIRNPILRQYVQDRAAWMQGVAAQSFVREYYAIIEVYPNEVLTDEFNQGDLAANMKKVPGNDLFQDFLRGLRGADNSSSLTTAEIKDRQLRELNRRRSDVASGLSFGGRSNNEVVDGDHLGILLKEYWEGTSVRESEAAGFVRKQPFVTGGTAVSAGDAQ